MLVLLSIGFAGLAVATIVLFFRLSATNANALAALRQLRLVREEPTQLLVCDLESMLQYRDIPEASEVAELTNAVERMQSVMGDTAGLTPDAETRAIIEGMIGLLGIDRGRMNPAWRIFEYRKQTNRAATMRRGIAALAKVSSRDVDRLAGLSGIDRDALDKAGIPLA